MKIRIYKNPAGQFRLLVMDKSIAVGVSQALDTEALATALGTEFVTMKTITVSPEGNFFVPKFVGTGGTIAFIKTGSQEEANKIKATIESTSHKLYSGVHEDFDAVMAASGQKVAGKAAAAVRKFVKGVTAMDNVVHGLVKCTLTYLPTSEMADILEATDETAFAGVVAAGSPPVAP
jgi:hypothetical protein